jgi:hypothetical protein
MDDPDAVSLGSVSSESLLISASPSPVPCPSPTIESSSQQQQSSSVKPFKIPKKSTAPAAAIAAAPPSKTAAAPAAKPSASKPPAKRQRYQKPTGAQQQCWLPPQGQKQLQFFPAPPLIRRQLPQQLAAPRMALPLPLPQQQKQISVPVPPPPPPAPKAAQLCIPLRARKLEQHFFIFNVEKSCTEMADWGHGECRHTPTLCGSLAPNLPRALSHLASAKIGTFVQCMFFEFALRQQNQISSEFFPQILGNDIISSFKMLYNTFFRFKSPQKVWGAANMKKVVAIWHQNCVGLKFNLSVMPIGGIKIKRSFLEMEGMNDEGMKLWAKKMLNHIDDVLNHYRFQKHAANTMLLWREDMAIIGDNKAAIVSRQLPASANFFLMSDFLVENGGCLRDFVFFGTRCQKILLCYEACPALPPFLIEVVKEIKFVAAEIFLLLFTSIGHDFQHWPVLKKCQDELIPIFKKNDIGVAIVSDHKSIPKILKEIGYISS